MKTHLTLGLAPLFPTALLSLGALLFTADSATAAGTLAWDKTFPQSPNVIHQKVSFNNRLGITLVADLYVPKNLDRSKKYPAIVVGGPYGAVKEQSAGLYAQTMAERGFVTVAHAACFVACVLPPRQHVQDDGACEPRAVQPERSTRASHSATSARRRSGCSWGSAWPASSSRRIELPRIALPIVPGRVT